MHSTVSFRVLPFLWMNKARCSDVLRWLKRYRSAIGEAAFFTGGTHQPLPLKVIQERAAILGAILPKFKALGLRVGINHLSTMGHLDENQENSLVEPWQHLVDLSGSVSRGCYCASDVRFREYVRAAYVALAQAAPEFIWVDDDVRMESHPDGVKHGCFCDLCMEKFSRETGKIWTREELKASFDHGAREDRLALRRKWLDHNRAYMTDLFADIRRAVDSVNPEIRLGYMSTEASYSGSGFAQWVDALAGTHRVEVKWRPGGGFYTDETPGGVMVKAHSIGRQIGFLPESVKDVQSEHENFPYQRLKKSNTIFQTEIAAYIGAGCTGTALNCMGLSVDPLDEYRVYFEGVKKNRPFFAKAVDVFGRSPCEGIWVGCTSNHAAIFQAEEGEWLTNGDWGVSTWALNEVSEIGLPMAYTKQGSKVTLLAGDMSLEYSRAELTKLLSEGVLLDGRALQHLQEQGLSAYTGFTVKGRKDRNTAEILTQDPINGVFAGWHRDCRPSFWWEAGYLLEPLSVKSRVIGETIDFTPVNHGPSSGVFENELGGRVAVLGYFPWKSIHSLAKSSQMKSLIRWLSRDGAPAYVGSYHKASLWCRRDSDGAVAVMLVNASLDTAEDLKLHIQGAGDRLMLTRMNGKMHKLESMQQDGPYAVFTLPRLAPWESVLVAKI